MSLVRKFSLHSVKVYGVIAVFLTISTQASADNVAIIGGIDLTGAPPYAALVSSSGELTPLVLGDPTTITGTIQSVSMNSSGISLIGGQEFDQTTGFTPAYAALVSSSGVVTPLAIDGLPAMHGIINSVAINNAGNGIIGGRDTTGPIYAALVPPSGNPLMPLTFPSEVAAGGIINSVAINNSGNSLVGGRVFFDAQPAYAALVSSSGVVTSLTLTGGIATTGQISSVSINASGNGMIGGQDLTGSQPAYAALVSSGTVIPLMLTGGGIATTGEIFSVAINDSRKGIIGGQDQTGSQPGYAALVTSSGAVVPLTLIGGVTTNGIINNVAINSAGNSIIGGQDLTGSQPAYAALFTSSGTVIPLTFTGGIATNGWINSVAWMESALPLFTGIPTSSLSGNNLIFADYINEFAPEDAFYFIPAELDGTLNAALQSAAPTRNGISIYTASNNLFFLKTSFANHIRNQQNECRAVTDSEIWFEAIGAWAHQKSQHQTVGFDPTTGGAILACDRLMMPQLRVGGGVSYLFTHIHEKEDQGHSNIHQEDAFVYGSWDNQNFYADMLAMGGALQIDQVRKTTMTGFSFCSSSHPNGWQLLSHLELGLKRNAFNKFFLNPFVMLDWVNAWQESYKEKGNSPFNAAQKSYYGSLLRTEAGLRFYETLFFNSWNFIIQEKISYVNTHSFNAGRVNAFLVGSPGAFTVETLSCAKNLGVAQLAMSVDPMNACYPKTTLFYQGEFGRQYQSHQVNIELAWLF